ncbi:MAG TPA: helix-turn-helix domain-containing protein [Solirubrobacterales bacterium]|nr:helix-turn-helix domain-containing protein [Solirubrobacterales bacterium]
MAGEGAPTRSKEDRSEGLPSSDGRISQAGVGLSRHLDEAVDEMVARIAREVPAYRKLSADEIENVRQLALRNASILSGSLESGKGPDRGELRFVAEHARERLRSGVSLESMLHAYRVGTAALWEACIAEGVALGFSRDTALELARRTSEITDALTTHAAETYVREESRLRTLSDRAARDLLETLLRGETDVDSRLFHLVAPGLETAEAFVVVLARVRSSVQTQGEAVSIALKAVTDSLATGRTSPLAAARSGAVVAIAPLEGNLPMTERLTAMHEGLKASGIEVFCGESSARSRLVEVPAAFDEAALAVSRASAEQPVVSLTKLPVVQSLLLGASTTMRGMLLARAKEIDFGDSRSIATMRTTLQAYADCNLNLSLTARTLHVHTNTLRYRLRRIAERTKIDPNTLSGLVDLLCLIGLLDEDRQVESSAEPVA